MSNKWLRDKLKGGHSIARGEDNWWSQRLVEWFPIWINMVGEDQIGERKKRHRGFLVRDGRV